MKLYAGKTIDSLLKEKLLKIETLIENESEDYILNVGETVYIDHLKSQFTIELPDIHRDKVYLESYETEVPGKCFPNDRTFLLIDRNKVFKKDVIVYYIPYTGDIDLLSFRPKTYTSRINEVSIDRESKSIKLEFINFYNDPERTKREYNEKVKGIFSCYDYLKREIELYNINLEGSIRSMFQQRRLYFLKKNKFLSSLGVPVKKNQTASETFTVPKPALRKHIIINKPDVIEKGFKPEPTVDNDTYQGILKIINDIGKNFERLPSVYSDKEEEDLRDHILFVLDPNFELGCASGETFNKTGKTDILLRYNSSNVFVAECKFWNGEKKFLETIDQLLNYLTWRDSKTSVIIFVRNKDMMSVVETVKLAIKKHNNFVRDLPSSDISWFNNIFSLPGDKNKEIKLAVQLFHIP